jgi:trans-aconitate 2-methyltransferase
MIASLSKQLAERHIANVVPIEASLTDFALPEQVECVFSNAVFHWILDDDALFACLYRATKPGGRLRAQCGGAGNNAHVLEAVAAVRTDPRFASHLAGFVDAKKYRTPEEATAALERAGWRDVRASLFAAPASFESDDDAALYLRTIVLRDHVARLPEPDQDPYVRAVIRETVTRHGPPYILDYLRLDLWATKIAGEPDETRAS